MRIFKKTHQSFLISSVKKKINGEKTKTKTNKQKHQTNKQKPKELGVIYSKGKKEEEIYADLPTLFFLNVMPIKEIFYV